MAQGRYGRAVVVGASMAGLLAARVLSDHADEVVLVERDQLPGTAAHRRGVPQATHAHVLLPRGLQIIERLFPGIGGALTAAGGVTLGDLADMSFSALGRPFSRESFARPPVMLATRPLVEHHVRSRVTTLPRVTVLDGTEVVGLAGGATRIAGVRLAEEPPLEADLVVVAAGRSGRLDRWLGVLGLMAPREISQPIGVRYATQPLAVPAEAVPEDLVVVGPRPGRPLGFYMPRNEDGVRLCTVMGYGTHGPVPRRDVMLQVVAELAPPHVADAVRRAEPLGPMSGYRFPASRRLRVGRTLPAGLLVAGDVLCSFNPIYGQGMTVAACQAVALGEALAQGAAGADGVERRYHLAADRVADQAWDVSVPADRTVLGAPQSMRERVEQRFLARLLDRATWDAQTAVDVLDVLTMSQPKQSLMTADAVRRALRPHAPAA